MAEGVVFIYIKGEKKILRDICLDGMCWHQYNLSKDEYIPVISIAYAISFLKEPVCRYIQVTLK